MCVADSYDFYFYDGNSEPLAYYISSWVKLIDRIIVCTVTEANVDQMLKYFEDCSNWEVEMVESMDPKYAYHMLLREYANELLERKRNGLDHEHFPY